MDKGSQEINGEILLREYRNLGRGEYTSTRSDSKEPRITRKVRDRTIRVKRHRIDLYSAVKILISVVVLMTVLNVINNNHYKKVNSDEIIVREPLKTTIENIDDIEYYNDQLGIIGENSLIEQGMKEFYKETGVRPYLYIVSDIEGNPRPDTLQIETWGNIKYNEVFDSEDSLLVIFLDNGNEYGHWLVPGKQAASVIDIEASKIIQTNMDELYKSELSDEEMFNEMFSKSAKEIMFKPEKDIKENILKVAIIITKILLVITVIINVRLLWGKVLRNKVNKIIAGR